MIKAALFDMDGVLFDSERVGRDIFLNLTEKMGYPQGGDYFCETLGVNYARAGVIFRSHWGQGYPHEAVMAELQAQRAALAEAGKIPLKKGVMESLNFLREKNIPAALVSGTDRELILTYLNAVPGLKERFSVIVSGDCGKPSKPDPAPYLYAAELLGVEPGDCIGIEDSLNGVKALRGSGAVSVCIPDLIPYSDAFVPSVDYLLPDLTALPALISRLNKGGRLKA